MRSFWRKSVTALLAASMTVSTVVPNGIVTANAAETVDATVKLTPASASVFNDTDGDGLGEFQGWGTSLCWWANRIGYSDKLTEKAADAFYGDDGLRMNIGRYNIGGGDNVGEIEEVSENENADIYDLSSNILPTFSGSSMKISSSSSYSSATYSQSDADFGITAGNTVGTIQTIGWINALNADAGSGGNLHYTIPVEKSGNYTIKMLFTLAGSNSRGVSMQVTNDGTDSENKMETTNTYTVEADDVNSDIIVSSGNNNIYRVTFTDVELAEGDNKIDIGGAGSDWCLDYIKMAVIESGKEGTLPETSDFYHASHITRSDAAVPGYATDVTKIDLDEHDEAYYEDNFERADFECGYAWNYDWDADSNQFNVLLAAAEKSGEDFIAEAFSNSPPYFMTESGCSSGNIDANEDNLREDSYTAFATYLADIIAHWKKEGIVDFESVDAMNEPYTDYWGAYSNKQEGCHFDQGESQSDIIIELNKALSENGINDIVISASDETSIDTAITSYEALSDEAKDIVDRIDTHTYSGSKRSELCELAQNEGKNLWMSEVDGGSTAGTDAGEMGAALWLAERIKTDVSGLESSAWILWNAIDAHIDESEADWSSVDYTDEDALYDDIPLTEGYWGIAHANHDTEELLLTKKYYAYGQFSRYIRPGMTIIASSGDSLAAYDPDSKEVVIVAMNTDDEDQTWKFNLSDFSAIGEVTEAVRTSGDLESGENWADVKDSDDIELDSSKKTFTADIKANSITTYVVDGIDYDSSEETIVSVEDSNIYAVEGTTAVLPDTVTVMTSKNNEKEVEVDWDTEGVDLTEAGEITGDVDGYEITANLVFVEPNMQYFIDCNNSGSTSYTKMDEYADLFNEEPDKAYEEGSWGYLDSYGEYNSSDVDDAWASGWYAKTGQDIDYTIPLEKGDYKVSFGFKEWWWKSGRSMKVYSVDSEGTENLLGTTSTYNGSNGWNTPSYDLELDEADDMTFSVRKATSSDPVLSFIKVQHILELDELKSAMVSANEIDSDSLAASKASRLKKLLASAQSAMLSSASSQADIDEINSEIETFIASDGAAYSESEIAANDYLLYLVDCASTDTATVPDDYKMGLYQSVTDQRYAEDSETGLKWGLAEDDENSIAIKGGSSDGTLTGTYYYTSPDISYVSGTSGFNYSFELPDRSNDDYQVTVGIKNPWSSRSVDIELEGETVADGITLGQSTLVENTYTTEVTDGELNVFVHNPDRTSQYADPIISYILVKAVPEYTLDSLKALLDSQAADMEGHEYSEDSQAVYDKAAAAAEALIDASSTDASAIEEAYDDLTDAFNALVEVFKTNYSSITGVSGDRIYDTDGFKIQAHGGQIQQFTINGETKYYWYGEDKTYSTDPVTGVHLYTSEDLYNWDDEGVVLKTIPVDDDAEELSVDLSVFEDNEYFKDLYSDYEGLEADDSTYDSKLEETYWNIAEDRCIMERPKVLYNEETGKYVMWWHCDGKTPVYTSSNYAKARAGVAISDNPAGPFKYLGAYKLAYSEDADHSYDSDEDELGAVRDMNLFKDDDGTAYISYSSDGNSNTYIAKLNDSYTGLIKDRDEMVQGEDFEIAFEGSSREASAMFKYNNKYYMITSGCTGWAANAASYAVADDPLGPWTTMGNPCTDTGYSTTYDTQSTCVFPVDAEAGKFIYMGDRWFNPDAGKDLSDSRYVWLPVEFLSGSKIALRRYSDWTLDELEDKGSFEVKTELPETVSSADALKRNLPDIVEIELTDGSKKTYEVEWDGFDEIGAMGTYEISGTLSNGREFSHSVNVVPEKTIYLFDLAAEELDYNTDYLTAARKFLNGRLKNTVSDDQKYSEENGAGYTGVLKSENSDDYDLGTKDSGESIWAHGFWAASNKSIDYKFDLEAGDYTVYTGYQEWWNTSRPSVITVTAENAGKLTSYEFTLSSSDDARLEAVSFSLENADSVTVSVAKTGSADPVMSFIGLVNDSMVIPETPEKEHEEETVPTDPEKETDPDKDDKPGKDTVSDDDSKKDTISDGDADKEPVSDDEKTDDSDKNTTSDNSSNDQTKDENAAAISANSPYGEKIYTDIINGVEVSIGYYDHAAYIGRKYQSAEDLGLSVSLNGHQVPTSAIKVKVSGKYVAGNSLKLSVTGVKNPAFAQMWKKVSKTIKSKSFEIEQYSMTVNGTVTKKKAADKTGQVIIKLGKNNKLKSAKAVVVYHNASGKEKKALVKLKKSDIESVKSMDAGTLVSFCGNFSGSVIVD